MFEWKTEYSVGIIGIDAQHQNLFAIARELYVAMSAGQGKASLSKLLDRLVQYTCVHFAHEERLLRESGYPDLVQHKAEHDGLTRQVKQFQADYKAGRVTITVQLLQFLRDWLEKHIMGTDTAYIPCLKQKQAPLARYST